MGLFDYFRKPKETAADRAAWLQGTVHRIGAELHNQRISALRGAARSFDAAETPPWVESWPTTAGAINEDLARQLPTLRARARNMARNDEWAIGYLIRLDDNVLGAGGMALQMRIKNAAGELDKDANARLEEAFATWGKDCEVSGLSWRDVESLALNAGPEDGELLYRFRTGRGLGRYGIQLQILDPESLDVSLHRDYGGNRVRMGKEINDDGKAVAYWIKATRVGDDMSGALTVGRHVRVPAGELHHMYLTKHVGQLRGYPWLAGGARRLWMLHDFEQAAAVASSNAAKRQGFFYTEDGEAPTGFADTIVSTVLETAKASGKVLTPDEITAIVAAAEKFNTTMPGQFDTLPERTRFQAFESKWPDVNSEGFVKQNLRGWAAARGMTYHTLGNDMEAVNFSSGRIGIGGEREHFKRLQGLLQSWLHNPVVSTVLPYLVLGTPKLSGTRLADYQAGVTWAGRRWPGIDPVKEATADEINLKNRTTSRRRIILQRGEDPEELDAEIAAEEAKYGAPDAPPRQTEPAEAKE